MLSNYAHAPDGSLSCRAIASVDRCRFGRWLSCQPSGRNRTKEFYETKIAHQRLHIAGAKVVQFAENSTEKSQMELLAAAADMARALAEMTNAARRLQETIVGNRK